MILGIDPLYLILVVIAAVAVGLGGFGFVMYKMLGKLTIIADMMTAIHAILSRPTQHPPFTQSLIDGIEADLTALRLAKPENAWIIASGIMEKTSTILQVSRPLEPIPKDTKSET